MRVTHLVVLTLLKLRLYLDLDSYEVNNMHYWFDYLNLSRFQNPDQLIDQIGKLVRLRFLPWSLMFSMILRLKN